MAQFLVGHPTPAPLVAPDPGPAAESTRFRFGEFRLCVLQRQLWRNGEPVRLTPRALDLLIALVRSSGHVVEREDLLRQVWGEVRVQDSNLTVNLCLLRRALGQGQRYIATVPGRGYQFVAQVSAELAPAAGWSSDEPASIWMAVMPFQRVGEPSLYPTLDEALGPAVVTALARVPGLRLRPTSVGAHPEADWRLEGWYQEVEQTVRITAQLVRTLDGGVAWAERRHFPAAEPFQLQDQIAAWLKQEISAQMGKE